MAGRSFILDFFFGPCLSNSAVDTRSSGYHSTYYDHERTSSEAIRLHQLQKRQQYSKSTNGSSTNGSRSVGDRSRSSRNSSRASNSSKRLISIPEDNRSKVSSSKSVNSKRNNLNRSSSTSNRNGSTKHINDSSSSQRIIKARNGGSQRNITSNNTHTINSNSKNHKPKSTRQQKPTRQSSNSKRCSARRDDASVMSTSLFETSTQFLNENDVNEQYAIQSSLVGTNITTNRDIRQQSARSSSRSKSQKRLNTLPEETDTSKQRRAATSERSQSSNKSELESYLDKTPQDFIERAPTPIKEEDYDNVTTISAASKNPYKVLGISANATPKEIYSTYKQKLKETTTVKEEEEEYDGDGEEGEGREYSNNQAFIDIGNAYRRLKADIQRQEAAARRRIKEEDQQQHQQGRGSSTKRKKKKEHSYEEEDDEDDDVSVAMCRRNNIDARLKDHRELVQDLFATDNNTNSSSNKKKRGKRRNNISSDSSVSYTGEITTLNNAISNQSRALNEMNLVPIEAGASNINEKNETIQNSCFYLSLATSYLSGTGSFGNKDPTAVYIDKKNVDRSGTTIAKLNKKQKHIVMTLALQLKRAIEAAVLLVHPDWAKTGQVGESVQAFSDFLVYALDSDSVLGHWSIVVFDDASGFTDVYRGRHYGKVYPPTRVVKSRDSSSRRRGSKTRYKYEDCDDETKRTNTLTLRYIPGHYQPLLPELTKMSNEKIRCEKGLYKRPMLEDILCSLEKYEVLHVVTDGRA